MQKRRSDKTFDLGLMYEFVYQSLVQDLSKDRQLAAFGLEKLRDPRAECKQRSIGAPPWIYKAHNQLRDFHKRLILKTDKTFEELSVESLYSFPKEQKTEIGLPYPMSWYTTKIVNSAREIVSEILGEFDYNEFFRECAFGKRAALGLTRSSAYLDNRICTMTGSFEQFAWYQASRASDLHLTRATRRQVKMYKFLVVARPVLKATPVPKSFKTARLVFPDTVLGGYLSRGLGNVLRRRLKAHTRIDLTVQQDRHKKWARRASRDGRRATIDMRRASNSFVWQHMRELMPPSWWPVLKVVRTPHYQLPEDKHIIREFSSYMLMGSGHTFPLQTLLFYALSEAVRREICEGFVSVYGDDIIVPTKAAPLTIKVLEELGFAINREKSFFDPPDPEWPSKPFFRESCGGDYYCGVDVRPYMPEDTAREVSKLEYLATVHKVLNGLLERWDATEIPLTVDRLLNRIESALGHINVIPEPQRRSVLDKGDPSNLVEETALAGVIQRDTLKPFLDAHYCHFPQVNKKTWLTEFWVLREKRGRRKPTEERIYYWYALWMKRNGSAEVETLADKYAGPDELLDKSGCEALRGENPRFGFQLVNTVEDVVSNGAVGSDPSCIVPYGMYKQLIARSDQEDES